MEDSLVQSFVAMNLYKNQLIKDLDDKDKEDSSKEKKLPEANTLA